MLVKTRKLAKIKVWGVVQGVGFRPFIYRLAHEHNLTGWVRNTSGSVEIEDEGDEASLKDFLNDLKSKTPPMAHIADLAITFHPPLGYTIFEIRASHSQRGKYQLVSPDIATCRDCLGEILSPTDRRYRSPVTN